jgi:predicted Rossmann-fold nucleotide-binding protein
MMSLNIGFAGASEREISVTYRLLAENIGLEIARRGHNLLSGGCSGGLTQFCAAGANDWLKSHDPDSQKRRIISIVPQNRFAEITCGQMLVCEDLDRDDRRPLMASLMDALITVSGGKGTLAEGMASLKVCTPVVPVWSTGGNSFELYREITSRFAHDDLYTEMMGWDEWQRLGDPLFLSESKQKALAATVVDIVEKMGGKKLKAPLRKSTLQPEGKVFVIMPFRRDLDPVWKAIQRAFDKSLYRVRELECTRGDERHVGKITESVIRSIREAPFVIADLTGNNPNVLFELGFSLAAGKKALLLNQHPGKCPIDLKAYKQIRYERGNAMALKRLTETLVSAIAELMPAAPNGSDSISPRTIPS